MSNRDFSIPDDLVPFASVDACLTDEIRLKTGMWDQYSFSLSPCLDDQRFVEKMNLDDATHKQVVRDYYEVVIQLNRCVVGAKYLSTRIRREKDPAVRESIKTERRAFKEQFIRFLVGPVHQSIDLFPFSLAPIVNELFRAFGDYHSKIEIPEEKIE